MRTNVLIAAALVMLAGLSVRPHAQTAPAAATLDSTLYKAADALGMLRGPQERDGIVTFEYWAKGYAHHSGPDLPGDGLSRPA